MIINYILSLLIVTSGLVYAGDSPSKIENVFGGDESSNEGTNDSLKSMNVFSSHKSSNSEPKRNTNQVKSEAAVRPQAQNTETKSQSVFHESRPNTNPKTPFKFKMAGPKTVSDKPEMLWPVETGYVSSMFGWRTSSRFHDGIDIASPIGTKVFAAEDGEVIYSDSKIHGYGNMIVIKHGNGIFSVYAHNKTNIADKGDRVNKGQHIADVGKTGRAYGAHLHFEVREGRYAVDPLKYVNPPARNRLASK